MVDFQLYGMNAAGHHFTSLLLHLANSILLFLLLAAHDAGAVAVRPGRRPVRAASAACGIGRLDFRAQGCSEHALFWMLTVWAYVRYVEEWKAEMHHVEVAEILLCVERCCLRWV
jgi:hypothetical protein